MDLRALAERYGIRVSDVLWAFGLLALGQWTIWFDWESYFPQSPPHLVIDSVTTTVACLALLLRQRFPVAVVLATGATLFLPDLLVVTGPVMWGEWAPFLVAAYSLAIAHGGRADVLSFGLAGIGYVVMSWRFPAAFGASAAAIMWFGPLVLAILVGHLIGRLRVDSADLVRRADELEQRRDEDAQRAVGEERQRIARELHDVIAHNVSIMVVQASAAENVLDTDAPAVRSALGNVQTAGREALEEMKLLLDVLRDTDETGERAPVPSLRRLDALLAPLRESGMDLEVETHGLDRRLPSSVDVSAYRVLQEALTNALRHAPGAPVQVCVQVEPAVVRLEVRNGGNGADVAVGQGHGLRGIRERTVLHGGHLHAGPQPEGGFVVRAELPITGAMRS
jgi:signal transduction histidine kinase